MNSPASAPLRTGQSGIVFMIVAMTLMPVGDTLQKALTGHLQPVEIGFWRFSIQALVFLCASFLLHGRVRVARFPLLVLGGLTSATTLLCLVTAFVHMPLATALALFFVAPLILTVLSGPFLGERPGWRRYAAVAMGLVGALLIIRPSWSTFGWIAILPLGGATSFSANAIILRKLSGHLDSLSIQLWFSSCGAVIMLVAMAVLGRPTLEVLFLGADALPVGLMLLLTGSVTSMAFFSLAEAFKRSRASTLAPFQYLQIVEATLLAYFVFAELPDLWTWIGMAIILGSGLYIIHRERVKRAEAAAQAASDGIATQA